MITVNEKQWCDLINKKMKEHPEYQEGMGVKLTPENSPFPSGLSIIGGQDVASINAWAEMELKNEYKLEITHRK